MTANLTARYEAALELSSAGDHSQAAEMLAECVAGDPADREFLEAFLKSLYSKEVAPASSDEPLPKALQIAIDARQWGEVRRLAPSYLVAQPGSVPALRAMAAAAAAAGHPEIELRYLEIAARVAPEDVELNRHRAGSLLKQGQFDAALACWGRVQDVVPDDAEATQMLVRLTIEQSRQRHGMESLDPALFAGIAQGQKPVATGLKPVVYQDERMLREILR
jgi:tetratricopeptide (TPR) repeat protein